MRSQIDSLHRVLAGWWPTCLVLSRQNLHADAVVRVARERLDLIVGLLLQLSLRSTKPLRATQ
jgi:hypothetical protein